MLDSIKEAGKQFGRELNRAWEGLSEGWRELLSRGNNALTHFIGSKGNEQDIGGPLAISARWSLLAGEVEETAKDIVVRIEVPGMNKEDCQITVDGNMLHLSGEKHYERESGDSTYHVMERAYGAFRRSIALPRNVDPGGAEARYKNGVLTVRLPKKGNEKATSIPVN